MNDLQLISDIELLLLSKKIVCKKVKHKEKIVRGAINRIVFLRQEIEKERQEQA